MKRFHSLLSKAPLLLAISISFSLSSCSSNDKKAQKTIKEQLRLTMHDFKSYEPVNFGKLEVAMSVWEDSPEVEALMSKEAEFVDQANIFLDKAKIYDYDTSSPLYLKNYRAFLDNLDSSKVYDEKIESFKIHFVPEVIGWKMQHSFRGKNLGGNFGIAYYEFYLDKECKKVIKTVDLTGE